MTKSNKNISSQLKIGVIGMGYVGMPLAISFSKITSVIGFDNNKKKISLYKSGFDPTEEIGKEKIEKSTVKFSDDENDLDDVNFFIIAVPTPINEDKTPDLSPLEGSSKIVAKHLKNGDYVVYESTVYPGLTEEFCIPILEKYSKLKAGKDFKVGYSPERINPGDRKHKLHNIKKIVSGMDKETSEYIATVYEKIIDVGVHKVSSIKTAEAIKVAENTQRDINVAFMNELAQIFNIIGIDSIEVVEAMNTKWNSLGFYPGLVGGHCIGVDPYYLLYKSSQLGFHSKIIDSAREVNDSMPNFIAEMIVQNLVRAEKNIKKLKISLLGLTFKENCKDIRNSGSLEILKSLSTYGIKPIISDPRVDYDEAKKVFGTEINQLSEIKNMDCVVFAVAHKQYKQMSIDDIKKLFKKDTKEKIIIDVKGILNKELMEKSGFIYWRL